MKSGTFPINILGFLLGVLSFSGALESRRQFQDWSCGKPGEPTNSNQTLWDQLKSALKMVLSNQPYHELGVNIIGPTTSLDVAQDDQIFHALGKCEDFHGDGMGYPISSREHSPGDSWSCLFSHFWSMRMSWNWVDHITMSKPEISHIFGSERWRGNLRRYPQILVSFFHATWHTRWTLRVISLLRYNHHISTIFHHFWPQFKMAMCTSSGAPACIQIVI